MRKSAAPFTLIFVTALMFAKPAFCEAERPLPNAKSLEALVSQWVDLRQETAAEERAWTQEKEWLRREMELLLREKNALQQELEQRKHTKQNLEQQLQVLSARKTELGQALESGQPALRTAGQNLLQWRTRLPRPLAQKIEEEFRELEFSDGTADSDRLERVLGLYSRIAQLQTGSVLVREVLRTPEGDRREFDVFYLGTAIAYAVSPGDRWAALGSPSIEGWQWEWDASLAPVLRKAVNMRRSVDEAAFVRLPVQRRGKTQ
ncbi:MAG: DUF3450 family protein [Candidatus Omnitrophica bacterium]|nr:DUF3450 family protein [Candidatus Omnitrophota bacterium]